MARFPKPEAKLTALARLIAEGLANAPDQFPSPPVPPAELSAQLDAYPEKNTALATSRAETKIRRVDKNQALKTMKDSMRANLRYAEVMVRRHPEKLAQLGWGARPPPAALQAPRERRGTA